MIKKLYPKVSIVIPIFNCLDYLKSFSKNYLKTDYPNIETLFIDDGSTDGTIEFIQSFIKKKRLEGKWKLVINKKRIGIAASRNVGIRKAKGEFVGFCEVDMDFEKNWLYQLVTTCTKEGYKGAIGKIFDYHDREVVQGFGCKIIPHLGYVLPVLYGKKDDGKHEKVVPTEISAVGSIVKRECVRKIDGYDEKLQRNVEDIDFGWRLWIAGCRTCFVPTSVVYHYTSKPLSKRKDVTNYWQQFHMGKNIRMIIKNYEFKNVLLYLPTAVMIAIYRSFTNLFKGNVSASAGIFSGLLWSFFTIVDTLKVRSKIQNGRELEDNIIKDNIMVSGNIFILYNKQIKPVLKKSTMLSYRNN